MNMTLKEVGALLRQKLAKRFGITAHDLGVEGAGSSPF
jgi:hypothetical protein